MPAQGFLTEYCWVVYAAGFKVAILTAKFPAIREAFANFDLDEVAELASVDPVLRIINRRDKAEGFLRGARTIRSEGWLPFQARVLREGLPVLRSLPFVGDINQKHLARNIGLLDTAKDDIWLKRLASILAAPSVDELANFLAKTFRESVFTVDLLLWRFCAEAGWESLGNKSLESFVARLEEDAA